MIDKVLTFDPYTRAFSVQGIGKGTFFYRFKSVLTAPVNNSVAFVNDPDLLFPVLDTEIWLFTFRVLIISATAADAKFTVTAPVGSTGSFGGIRINSSGLAAVTVRSLNDATGIDAATGGSPLVNEIQIPGFIIANGNGNVQLQFAQNTANASDTQIQIGSHLEARNIRQ